MTLAEIPLAPLERGQLQVMRVRALGNAAVLIAAAVAGEIFLAEFLFRQGVLAAPAVPVALWLVLVAPPRKWRHWGYAFTGSELHVAHGWWTRVHTIVPVMRVQHIDVTQGPVERAFGVSRLVLHTAGTDDSLVALPGITRETAEEIRDSIRAAIGSAQP